MRPLSPLVSPRLGCWNYGTEGSSLVPQTYGVYSAWPNCCLCGCWKPSYAFTRSAKAKQNKAKEKDQLSWLMHTCHFICSSSHPSHFLYCVTDCTQLFSICTSCMHREWAIVRDSCKFTQEFRESKAIALCMKDVCASAQAHTTS